MVACYRNSTTCTWHYFDAKKFRSNYVNSSADFEIDYDIHLVNGNPGQSSANPFTFHFSFDQQYILEMNLIFLVVYLCLVPMQIYAVRIQKHPVTKLFTISLILEFISLLFIMSYYINYTISGVGNESIRSAGEILDIFSRVSAGLASFTASAHSDNSFFVHLRTLQTSFMLILLLLAKGWAVTRQQITRSNWNLLMSIWIPYCAFHVVLYIWNRVGFCVAFVAKYCRGDLVRSRLTRWTLTPKC